MPNETLTVVYTRLGGKLRDEFENWRRAQPVIPARSEALRSLLDKALDAERLTPAQSRRIADTPLDAA